MSLAGTANMAAVVCLLLLSVLGGLRAPRDVVGGLRSGTPAASAVALASARAKSRWEPESRPAPGGGLELKDARGRWHLLSDFRRIVSGGLRSDDLLLQLAEPDRVVAYSPFASNNTESAYLYSGKPQLSASDDLERILALDADLVLLNSFGVESKIQRYRDAGLVVFDLGEMGGQESYLRNMLSVGYLLGRPERARQLAKSLLRRGRRLAPVGESSKARRRGIYLSLYGKQLYTGARGTSYHSVLTMAGLENAAGHLQGWPQLSVERVLTLDPQVVLTQEGMGPQICESPGLEGLGACSTPGGVVELPSGVLHHAGSGMWTAAERLVQALAGER